MIEPQVEHGGASSWFCIAANLEATGAEAPVLLPEAPVLLGAAAAGVAFAAPAASAPKAVTSSVSCSGVVTTSGMFTPARYWASGDRNLAAIHRKM